MTAALNYRQPTTTEPMPEAEFAQILGSHMTLSIVADGQTYMVRLSRRRLLSLLESGFEALKEQEPGWK